MLFMNYDLKLYDGMENVGESNVGVNYDQRENNLLEVFIEA